MSLEGLYWCGSIFLWSFFTGIGLPPVPEEAGILYAASVTALNPEVFWWMSWPAASLGIITADLVLYGIGRFWGQHVLEFRWVNRILAPDRRQQIEARFHDHGMKFLLLARLLPPLRTGVFLIAGTIHYSILRFLIADLAYGIVGVGLVFFGGTALMSLIHQVGNGLLIVLTIGVVGFGLIYYYRYLRRLELKASVKAVEAVAPVVAPEEAVKDDSTASNGKTGDVAHRTAAHT